MDRAKPLCGQGQAIAQPEAVVVPTILRASPWHAISRDIPPQKAVSVDASENVESGLSLSILFPSTIPQVQGAIQPCSAGVGPQGILLPSRGVHGL